ncbi:MAG: FecR family protein [Chloroflexi bacterium]|nr:FecR family protein [Chloroflexota bacterium]
MVLAWVVLWMSFFAFVLLAAGIPWAVNTYLYHATESRQATLSILGGTVLVQERGAKVELNALNGKTLEEGDQVRTTASSQAVIWFFEGSNLRLWPNAEVIVERLRTTSHNDRLSSVGLRITRGHARVEVGMPVSKEHEFEVDTPHGPISLREGSYTVEVSDASTEIVARYGSAVAGEDGHTLEIGQSERATLQAGEPPAGPLPAARNLISNGDFSEGLNGWIVSDDAEEEVVGTTALEPLGDKQAVVFRRQGGTKHGENRLFQALNRDVSDLQTLQLSLDLKLSEQTLSGGGWQGSEYPLMVRVKYRDVYDSEAMLVRGFYFQNNDKHPTPNGQQVPRNEWQNYTIDLFDLSTVKPRPNFLIAIEVVASGWDYESRVANVRLAAE